LNRAVQSAEFPSHEFASAVREMLAEITERMEGPAHLRRRYEESITIESFRTIDPSTEPDGGAA
jgi:hypothetical protein